MCLAIPGRILSIEPTQNREGKLARVSFGGIVREASLEFLPAAEVGDYVLVHVGVAISSINEAEAAKVFEYLKQAGELDELYDPSA
jgi:hydrogenase expression/formation protein HypC